MAYSSTISHLFRRIAEPSGLTDYPIQYAYDDYRAVIADGPLG
jgi:hypothetical protein